MFDIGFWELSLIAVIALLILGPDRLPRVARTAGLWVGKMRRMVADVKSNIDEELRMEELNALKKAGEDLKDGLGATQKEFTEVGTEFKNTVEEASIEAEDVDIVSAIRESVPKTEAAKEPLESDAAGRPVQADDASAIKKKTKRKAKRKAKKKGGSRDVDKPGRGKTAKSSTGGKSGVKKSAAKRPRSGKTSAEKENSEASAERRGPEQSAASLNSQDQST